MIPKFLAYDKKLNKNFEVNALYFENGGILVSYDNNSKIGYLGGRLGKYLRLMMFTGLTDKNGKEACQEDILKLKYLYVVKWSKKHAGFYLEPLKDTIQYKAPANIKNLTISKIKEMEIMGNTYRTPRFLE